MNDLQKKIRRLRAGNEGAVIEVTCAVTIRHDGEVWRRYSRSLTVDGDAADLVRGAVDEAIDGTDDITTGQITNWKTPTPEQIAEWVNGGGE